MRGARDQPTLIAAVVTLTLTLTLPHPPPHPHPPSPSPTIDESEVAPKKKFGFRINTIEGFKFPLYKLITIR